MKIILKKGREKSLLRFHPWIFTGAVHRTEGNPQSGDIVEVVDASGKALALAGYSPASQICGRVWTFEVADKIDRDFFARKVSAAINARRNHPHLKSQNGMRLIHAESDGLPGITVDQYGAVVVMQLTSAGADVWRHTLVDVLQEVTSCSAIYERSDSDVRQKEGLSAQSGWRFGSAELPVIDEFDVSYQVDIVTGHKTGFYLDQRDNRAALRDFSAGKRVLNCFCYTGGFSLQALAGGAEQVVSIDSSGPALAQAAKNLARNPQLDASRAQWVEADVFKQLRTYRDDSEKFDIVVLDPPKFAANAGQIKRAANAYKDINLLAMKLLNPGGLLFTYSCSGHISADLFQKIVAGAAVDAGVEMQIIQRLSGGADHPVGLAFPEGEYLKGLVLAKLG